MFADAEMEPPETALPFLQPHAKTQVGSLAILHLRRDSLLPVVLRDTADEGYAEGAVTNTRFGSFPHSTLLDLEWGSQVRASKVDTGSRGRKGKKAAGGERDGVCAADSSLAENSELVDVGKKRKGCYEQSGFPDPPLAKKSRQEGDQQPPMMPPRTPVEAGSGFIHILQPTPESWTSSLDHRTQVVYTPDYSYILHRLRVQPGGRLIEAGAGSGSFTHAAVRAVFSGHHAGAASKVASEDDRSGKVYSFEYHEPRVHTLQQELDAHGLDSIVTLTHRDVYNEGFELSSPDPNHRSPKANAIFLDLPAPWLALRHLTRRRPNSPLDPSTAVHLCTFSPCIEQVTATVDHLRKNGWVGIEMVEVANRRIDVRRELVGHGYEGLRGVNASAATVDEAVDRLREVEAKLNEFHSSQRQNDTSADNKHVRWKQERLRRIQLAARTRKTYKEGNLVHRTQSEIKTHTSYLVFAILPKEWSEADERACRETWPVPA